MEIGLLRYINAIARHEISLVAALAPFVVALGFLGVLRFFGTTLRRSGVGPLVITAVLAALVGLSFTTLAYRCSWCAAPQANCETWSVGFPLRQHLEARDSAKSALLDVCGVSTPTSQVAAVLDFAAGVAGSAFVLVFVPKRGTGKELAGG